SSHSVSRHIDHIIYPSQYAIVAVMVSLYPIPGKIHPFVSIKISLFTSFMIPISGPYHAWPWKFNTQITLHRISCKFLAFRVDYHYLHPTQRKGSKGGFGRGNPCNGGDHYPS